MARYHTRRGRDGKIKIQHSMLPGLEAFLKELVSWPELISAIPARIRQRSRGKSNILMVQYETIAGLKCNFKSNEGLQEVFLVTGDAKALRKKLAKASFKHAKVEQ